jgi:alanyl-tRNA synthetase
MDEARERRAIGLFEAKYGERVRVIQFGPSIELCGGTHVSRTGDIGSFAIVSEAGIAQGVRRIEAVTGMAAVEYVQSLVDLTDATRGLVHAHQREEIPAKIEKLQQDLKAKQREIEALKQRIAMGGGGAAANDDIADVDGVRVLVRNVGSADSKTLRAAADALREKLGSGIVVLGAEADGKATLLVAVSKDLEARVPAGKVVAALAPKIAGKGGGRPELAQAGGPNLAGLDDALKAAREAVGTLLRG